MPLFVKKQLAADIEQAGGFLRFKHTRGQRLVPIVAGKEHIYGEPGSSRRRQVTNLSNKWCAFTHEQFQQNILFRLGVTSFLPGDNLRAEKKVEKTVKKKVEKEAEKKAEQSDASGDETAVVSIETDLSALTFDVEHLRIEEQDDSKMAPTKYGTFNFCLMTF